MYFILSIFQFIRLILFSFFYFIHLFRFITLFISLLVFIRLFPRKCRSVIRLTLCSRVFHSLHPQSLILFSVFLQTLCYWTTSRRLLMFSLISLLIFLQPFFVLLDGIAILLFLNFLLFYIRSCFVNVFFFLYCVHLIFH